MSDWVGRTLSKVILLKRLGRGGMAEVYLGHHTTLERQVAVKILHGFLAEDAVLQERFRSEAQGVAAMRHPNITQVFDFDIIDDRPYIVMEYIDGLSLEEYLQQQSASNRRMPPETVSRLTLGLAAALDYAHLRGIVHRDIKPGNVMLRRDGGAIDPQSPLDTDVEPVLGDFGVARFIGNATLSDGQSISGTPAYLSPEQARGEAVDGRSDLYSLSVMIYEMLAGHLPFEPSPTSPFTVILQHLTELPPPLPGASPELQTVLARALAKDPVGRYPRAGELAAALLAAIFPQAARVAAPDAERYPQLAALVDALNLLVAQARTYERALPGSNTAARTATRTLGELGRKALNEAHDLAEALRPAPPAAHPFSPRELEVLHLAASGLTNKEIAYRLGISERTIQFHINSVFNKTGTQSRTEVVALALKQGWIDLAV